MARKTSKYKHVYKGDLIALNNLLQIKIEDSEYQKEDRGIMLRTHKYIKDNMWYRQL